jgi:type IV secretory pathway VirB2 component (pilin)
MHPSFTANMSTTRMEQFQREAMAMQRVNHAKRSLDNTTGSSSLAYILWYVLFGLHIPSSSQKQGEAYTMQSFQARINATIWMIGCIAFGLGLLIGSFINSNFGLLPIVLLCSIILVAVSLPIVTRSASMLSKHTHVPSHR